VSRRVTWTVLIDHLSQPEEVFMGSGRMRGVWDVRVLGADWGGRRCWIAFAVVSGVGALGWLPVGGVVVLRGLRVAGRAGADSGHGGMAGLGCGLGATVGVGSEVGMSLSLALTATSRVGRIRASLDVEVAGLGCEGVLGVAAAAAEGAASRRRVM